MKFIKITIIFCLILISCTDENKVEEEIAKIPVDIKIERFDQLFSEVTPETLSELKSDYPFLFPKQYNDNVWIKRSRDTLQLEINREVQKAFTDFSKEKEELHSFLQHVKYYFPEVTTPRVITITSDVDYHNKVVLSDNLLLLSLDTYLGTDHYFYESLQKYLKQNFVKEQMLPDVATIYTKQLVELPKNQTLLANMIYYGKELYLKELFLPGFSIARRMGYTEDQYAWAEENEEEIWRYFIDRKLLYDTDRELSKRFLYAAPFSKFYLEEIDQEAPGRIGQYIGAKIVASYMENNKVALRQLLMTDAETIFTTSKYKPAR